MASKEFGQSESAQAVINFLKSNVPRSDVPNIEAELKKEFVFAKKKSKSQRKKPSRKKARCLTREERKTLGFYTIPRNSVKYTDVLPMHSMWVEYMTQVLELDKSVPSPTGKNWDSFTQSFYKADFHGSILRVVRSKCPSYVGKLGICIMDTRNTFKIVSKDNVVTTIPKKESVFEMHLKHLRITLFGKHLCVRPAERSTKKIKTQQHPDLI